VGQAATGQDGQWADGLAREYGQRLSGRSQTANEDGQWEPEGQPMQSGSFMSARGQDGSGSSMGQNVGGSPAGRTLQGGGRRQVSQDSAGGQAYGRNGYRRNEYGHEEQASGTDGNRQRGQRDGERMPFGNGPASGSSGNRRREPASQGGRSQQGQGGYGTGQPDRGDKGRQQAGTGRTQVQRAGAGTGQAGETAGNSGRRQAGAGTGDVGRQQFGMGTGNTGRWQAEMGTGSTGLQRAEAGTGSIGRQQGGMGTGSTGRQQGGMGTGSTGRQRAGAGTGNTGLQQTGAGDAGLQGNGAAGNNGRRRNDGMAGTDGQGRGDRRTGAGSQGQSGRMSGTSGPRQSGRASGASGRQQNNKKPEGDGKRRNNGRASGSRRPPGTSAGKKGLFGSMGRKPGTAAGAKGRISAGQEYKDGGNPALGAQNRNRGVQGHQGTGQKAKPPGYGSGARRKPGSGVNFLVQGSILAAAGIIVRLIGMVYRIPLAKKIGDVGNGYYNAAYSIYSILLIMSSYSLPTAVSKMVSARLAKGQYRTSTRIFRASMFYATMAGMAGFCALWFGADYFASEIIKMPFSSYALKSLAPTIWIMAYLGVLRGYFQGHSTMIPTAVSQVFEQVVNAVVSIVAASVLFDMGVKSNLVFHNTEYSYAFGAAGGAIGTGAGALTALILFLLLTMGYVPTMRKQAKREKGNRVEGYGAISYALFVTIVPIMISSAIYNISNVVDNSIFGHMMEGLGESGQTASQWGVYMGRYHMLFNIPVAIANSLSSSLIPSLSRAAAEKNRREILLKIGSAIRFSMIIAIPSAVGLTVLAGPVSNLLFSGMDNEMLIKMMVVGSSAVVFFSLSTVGNAILQGINRMQVPIINSAVSLGIHVGALYVMLGMFHMGIYSVVYANILFAALVCMLNAISIARYTRYRQEIVKTFLIPCVASAAMGGAAWGVYRLCAKAGNAVGTAAAILAAIVVYFVLLIKLKGVDAQELRSMPGGTRLLGVARKLRLM